MTFIIVYGKFCDNTKPLVINFLNYKSLHTSIMLALRLFHFFFFFSKVLYFQFNIIELNLSLIYFSTTNIP